MLKKLYLWMVCLLLAGAGVYGENLSNTGEIKYKKEIAPYVDFLKKQNQKPVDYVMGLFEKYDLVILCERAHPETTQYDFIYDLVSDKRFIEKVGNMFTELGTSTMNGYLHDFLFTDGLSDKEVENKVLYIYRNFFSIPFWEKYNFYDFLKRLYTLNKSLAVNAKINLYFSDMPFSWQGMTKEKYQQFRAGLGKRDWVMADQIIKKFADIAKSTQLRKKALVIMNYRHAFNDFKYADGTKADNVGRYIFEALPGKVANVMLNSVANLYNPTEKTDIASPVSNGKWDAAFEVIGNPNIGFDFKGNPFGADYFDLFPYEKHNLTYQEVFTGFIFYKPLKEHKYLWGNPKFFADGYDKIILDRQTISGYPVAPDKVNEFIKENETLVENTYENITDMMLKINQWLLPAKK
ncbi:MAG: hypothetical protein NTW95_04790 [Candidatus Aminicenantes bacterium]|nr:hypothetical protein [Candidatus Aminicenantes bacterium]